MAKQKVLNTNYSFQYSCRDENHNTIRDFNMNFENPDDDAIVDNLNTFLTAVGLKIRVGVVD
jgi:hypothetical protein